MREMSVFVHESVCVKYLRVLLLTIAGTFLSESGVVGKAVETALEVGYRAIDCAAVYGNEKEIGEVLLFSWVESGVDDF